MAQAAPLMPKATAVWLVENTALSFDQVADFCKLHPLEVKAIADGDAAQGIKGLDPIQTGQLSREEIDKAEGDPDYRLKLLDPKVRLPVAKRKKGPRYTPVSRRQDRPNAILWLVRNHPELKDAQIMRLVGTTKSTIRRSASAPTGTRRPCSRWTRSRSGSARRSISISKCTAPPRRSRSTPRRRARRCCPPRRPRSVRASRRPTEKKKPCRRAQRRCGVRQAQADRRRGGKSDE